MSRQASPRRNRRCSLRSTGALPFCTSAPSTFQRLHVVSLRRAGGAADAVTAGATAEQDDPVAGGRGLTAHMVGRGGGHDRAHLHALGHIAGVVDLVDLAGGEPDLVAVRAVAGGRGGHELALGQLAFKRFGDRHGRIGGTGDAHRLIHVGAARQGVADRIRRCRWPRHRTARFLWGGCASRS